MFYSWQTSYSATVAVTSITKQWDHLWYEVALVWCNHINCATFKLLLSMVIVKTLCMQFCVAVCSRCSTHSENIMILIKCLSILWTIVVILHFDWLRVYLLITTPFDLYSTSSSTFPYSTWIKVAGALGNAHTVHAPKTYHFALAVAQLK